MTQYEQENDFGRGSGEDEPVDRGDDLDEDVERRT